MWFTEKSGHIKALDISTGQIDSIHFIDDVFVSTVENSGLHSLCFHPQWPDSSYFFCHYTFDSLAAKLVRYEYDQETKTVVGQRDIFPQLAGARSHNGSRLQLGPDGMIYWSVGDAYLFDPAQQLESLNGKVNRFAPDGSIPTDNPFEGSYAYSVGHRNPQGLVWGSNGKLYASEHGTNADDEINLIVKGANYGWPGVSGKVDLPVEQEFAKGKTINEPINVYTPTKAPSGMAYYNHEAIPEWKNCLLQAFLKDRSIGVIELDEAGEKVIEHRDFFASDFYRLRDVEVLETGEVYFCTSNHEVQQPPLNPHDDKIIQIRASQHYPDQQSNPTPQIILNEDETISIRFNGYTDSCEIRYTRFYNVTEFEDNVIGSDSDYNISWKPTEAQPYFVKLRLADGRMLYRRIVWQ